MDVSFVDIVELYRLRAVASQQYLIDKLKLDDTKSHWFFNIVKDQDKWKDWFLHGDKDGLLRKELALLLLDSSTCLPLGFQRAIQAQRDSIEREWGHDGVLEESLVHDFYWEDIFQENIRVRGLQERKNNREYQLLDQAAPLPSRKRQRSRTEDNNCKESSSRRTMASSANPGTSSELVPSKSALDTSNFSCDIDCNHLEQVYRLKASYRRDSFRMAEFVEKTKCFPCCDSSVYGKDNKLSDTCDSFVSNMDCNSVSLQPECFDMFSCVPDVPLVFTRVENDHRHPLGRFNNLWSFGSKVMENCRRLKDIYRMKETFARQQHLFISSSSTIEVSSPSKVAADNHKTTGDNTLLQVMTSEWEAEKCPPEYEWLLLRSCLYSIFMQIGFTHSSQHALDMMTDILYEKLHKLGSLLCGIREYDCSSYYSTEQVIPSEDSIVWYMKDHSRQGDDEPLEHLLRCLYRCGLLLRVQDLLHYYSVELPNLSNTIIQVENEWKKRLYYNNNNHISPTKQAESQMEITGNSSSCLEDHSEEEEQQRGDVVMVFGKEQDGELKEAFRCFGYLGNNHYLDILQLHTLSQGYYLQVPPSILFATIHNQENKP